MVAGRLHSFLAQAKYLGEVVCGLVIAAVARFAGLPPVLVVSGSLFVITIRLVCELRTRWAATEAAVSPNETSFASTVAAYMNATLDPSSCCSWRTR